MFGLRSKILLGFGGLLLVLVAIGLRAETVLGRYSAAMQRMFREDYDSVVVCQAIKEKVEGIDLAIQWSLWTGEGGPDRASLDRASLDRAGGDVDRLLDAQRADSTLPGEREATEELAAEWASYRDAYRLLPAEAGASERRRAYLTGLLPESVRVRALAQRLIDMNVASIRSVPGKVAASGRSATWAMHVLTASGIVLGLAYAAIIARKILLPVRRLTESVRQIERGNLESAVPVHSRDELGALASAFNSMAAQLRAYRRRDHERLVRTERTTQLAVDSLPDAVLVISPRGDLELTNEAAKRLFALRPGMNVDAAPPWLGELYRRALSATQAAELANYESAIEIEVGGELRFLLPRTVPIRDEAGGRLAGSTVVLADVTGLRRIDEAKNGLLSLVSHELKTPLTSTRMVLHLMADGKVGPLSPRQADLVSAARDDADRLHQIVETLLDMARIESGKALMEVRQVAPRQLASDSAELLRGAFQGQQIALDVDVPADLPLVRADPVRVGHVFANLLSNALRYTPAGGHVRVTARQEGPAAVEFIVTDDGSGIPPQHAHRVFEKFFRVPGQPGSSGSGLGLAVAKHIVEAHGGRIRMEPNAPSGTTFRFTLPAVPAGECQGSVEDTKLTGRGPAPQG